MKYELHAPSCRQLETLRCYCEDRMGHDHGRDCDGPKLFEALMTAARDEIQSRNAMGALAQAVEAIEGKK